MLAQKIEQMQEEGQKKDDDVKFSFSQEASFKVVDQLEQLRRQTNDMSFSSESNNLPLNNRLKEARVSVMTEDHLLNALRQPVQRRKLSPKKMVVVAERPEKFINEYAGNGQEFDPWSMARDNPKKKLRNTISKDRFLLDLRKVENDKKQLSKPSHPFKDRKKTMAPYQTDRVTNRPAYLKNTYGTRSNKNILNLTEMETPNQNSMINTQRYSISSNKFSKF